MFAGEGINADGKYGSPLILLDELRIYCKDIIKRKLFCKLIFNEFEESKFEKLTSSINLYLNECKKTDYCPNSNKKDCVFNLTVENKDFKNFFSGIYKVMSKSPRLPRFMFLDQYGIKQITEEIFTKLVNLKRTDFIFFISSSFASRFAEIPEFKRYLKLSRQHFDVNKPFQCHRVIFEYYKQLNPQEVEYHLALSIGHFFCVERHQV